MKDRFSELEFYFPLKPVTPRRLKTIFAGWRAGVAGDFPGPIEDLNFAPAQGFMKGFIDLIFHCRGGFTWLTGSRISWAPAWRTTGQRP